MPPPRLCHGKGCARRPTRRVEVVAEPPGFEGAAPGEVVFTLPACKTCAPQVRREVKHICQSAPVVVRVEAEDE